MLIHFLVGVVSSFAALIAYVPFLLIIAQCGLREEKNICFFLGYIFQHFQDVTKRLFLQTTLLFPSDKVWEF